MQTELPLAGARRAPLPLVGPDVRPLAADPGPLGRPGILVEMIGPDTERTTPVPHRTATGAFPAVWIGGGVASAVLAVHTATTSELPFGEFGFVGRWLPLVAAIVLVALQSAPTARRRVHHAPWWGALLGAAACACMPLQESAIGCLLLVASLAIAVVSVPASRAACAAMAIGAGAVLAVWHSLAVAPPFAPLVMLAACSAWVGLVGAARWRANADEADVTAGSIAWPLVQMLGGALAVLVPDPLGGLVLAGSPLALAPTLWFGFALAMRRPIAAGLAALVTVGLALAGARGDAADDALTLVVARHGNAEVRYTRADQTVALWAGGRCRDALGPDRCEAALATTWIAASGQPGDRITVLGLGSGAIPQRLAELDRFVVDVVDDVPDAAPLRPSALAAGPVAPRGVEAAAVRSYCGLARAVSRMPTAGRQFLVIGGLGPAPWSCDGTVQQELRRVVGTGCVVQAMALDRATPGAVWQWFAAAHAAHAWNGLFVVGDAAVLVSCAAAPNWGALGADWSDADRWLAHAAHIGSPADLQAACRGTLRTPSAVAPETADAGPEALRAVLHAWLAPTALPDDASAPSLLQHWTAQRAELRRQLARLSALPDSEAGRQEALAIAVRWLPVGAPHAALQAASGLGGEELAAVSPATASRRAFAIDPCFAASAPPVFRSLPVVQSARGELEDLASLPPPHRLADLAVGDTPLAIALRARFPSSCARALVARLRAAPLEPAAVVALRELADPFVLEVAAAAVASRAGERELLGIWRNDLRAPAAIAVLVQRSAEERQALANALCGRRGESVWPLLAALLEADELPVRETAGRALAVAIGEAIPYDPCAPHSVRHEAAERVRALHNRAP